MDEIIALLRLKLRAESSFDSNDYKMIVKYIDHKIEEFEKMEMDEFSVTYITLLKDIKQNFNNRLNKC